MTKDKPIPSDTEAPPAAERATDAADFVHAERPGDTDGGQASSAFDPDQARSVDWAMSDHAVREVGSEGTPEDFVRRLQAELAAAEERVLRAHAELENYRKRANRLLEEERKYAPLPLIRDLLPILDNLERAIQSASQDGGAAGLLEGVRMVAQQVTVVLERHHCQRIEAQGTVFDPHMHEAIAQFPSEQVPPGTVIEVTLPGYRLHDRVVRPSQVLVSSRPAGNAEG